VIVDTPLEQLDGGHRLSVVQSYFPQVSHQVILLAMDLEVDDQELAWLQQFRRLIICTMMALKGKPSSVKRCFFRR
jgi:DNA sulfur modification protein DndD